MPSKRSWGPACICEITINKYKRITVYNYTKAYSSHRQSFYQQNSNRLQREMLTEWQQSGSICFHIADRCNYTSKSTQGLPLHKEKRKEISKIRKISQKKTNIHKRLWWCIKWNARNSHRTKKIVLINQSDSKNKRKMSKEQNNCKRKNLYCHTGPKSEAHLNLQPTFSFTAGKEWFGAQVSKGATEGTGIV